MTRLTALMMVAVAFVAPPGFGGQIENGGFETCDLTGWVYTDHVQTVHEALPLGNGPGDPELWTPTRGQCFAYLTTQDGLIVSLTQIDLDLTEGQVLALDVFFDAGNPMPFNDVATVFITPPDSPEEVLLFGASVETTGDYGAVGWVTTIYEVQTDGPHDLTINLYDGFNDAPGYLDSAIGIDNVRVIPEPGTAAILVGPWALTLLRRRIG